ncbi:MAG: hypothetical protein NZM31_06180 [Gemmatales bacterium]|nr:hypothetical protein [Gemmatales bacterium]MDW8386586.1 hypothetical protein [Gemmatales bacterium]
MVRVECDLCGKEIRPGEEQRFVVKIEVFPVNETNQLTEEDLDEDHLEEVSQLLAAEECGLAPNGDDSRTVFRRFDLCPACRKRFLKDPLGREAHLNLSFSEN